MKCVSKMLWLGANVERSAVKSVKCDEKVCGYEAGEGWGLMVRYEG